mgnify:CR=1 FL=1
MEDFRKIKLSPRTEGLIVTTFGVIFLLELLGVFSMGFRVFLLILAGAIIFYGLDKAHALHTLFKIFKKN